MDLGKPKLCTKFEVTSFSHCINIKGKPSNFGSLQIFGRTPTPGPRPFSYACDFMMVLGKTQLRAKFEVANFSRCKNIIMKLKNFGELP